MSADANADPLDALAMEAPKAAQALRAGARTVTDVAEQPVRDVGLLNPVVPDALARAASNPYGLASTPSCEALSSEIKELSIALGPDVDDALVLKENRVEQIVLAGGKSIVASFIPFRTVVREVSGAAPAQRRFQETTERGFARRGFLKGVYEGRDCQSTLANLGAAPVRLPVVP